MGRWVDDKTWEVDPAARGMQFQLDAAPFWERLFQRLAEETRPFDRVVVDEWDGPRFVVYAHETDADVGYDTGWRMQCKVPAAGRAADRQLLFVAGAGRPPAVAGLLALKRRHPRISFWGSSYGEGFGSRLPL